MTRCQLQVGASRFYALVPDPQPAVGDTVVLNGINVLVLAVFEYTFGDVIVANP